MSAGTTVSQPSEREVQITRSFAASAASLFAAYTQPELIKRWQSGPEGWQLTTCQIDLRVDGRYRYEWQHTGGEQMGMSGTFLEIDAPSRLVSTELFDADWTGGETVVTTTFAENGDTTTVTTTIRYSSQAARDGALQTGMTEGMEASYGQLEQIVGPKTAGEEG